MQDVTATRTAGATAASRLTPRLWRPPLPSVKARLGYIVRPDAHPVSYMYDPPAGVDKDNSEFDFREVTIKDARRLGTPATLDQEGFSLWRAPTQVEDFRDEETVKRQYYLECIELACAATGGNSAIVFDHLVRKREAGRPALTFGRYGDGSNPGGVGRVHNDYSEESGRKRLAMLVGDAALAARLRRFCVVNIWRSAAGPIVDTPLAVCDARTVSARDLVVSEIRYPNRVGEIYMLEASPSHRWYYYPEMERQEALVFKQYDSQVNGVARFTPHAAFDLPDIPSDAPLRESIEVRCLVMFE